uniref:UDP-glucose:glycoprotein glucosyltransferase (inferred by orthology to a D. melanogaster protein) n=1 Tax=Nippostrongylus brasiliensis TaxID=27835 RepID=A0A0N4XT99_NIPBR
LFLSEFIANEDKQLFWAFTSAVAEESPSLNWNKATDEEKYDFGIKQASKILTESSVDLLKLSLSIRVYSPTVQLFQQIGEDWSSECSAFFDVHGVKVCNANELGNAVEAARESAASTVLSIDHVLDYGKNMSSATIILYGDIGSPEWLQLHNDALELARKKKLRYVFRHYVKPNRSDASKVSLSGFGVELAIKNTEYKAVDDSEQGKNKEEDVDQEDLYGFNFKLLKEQHAESSDALEAFKMHLKEIQELAPLKQWQVQDLSFQAAQRVVNSGGDNVLNTLAQLSQDFPRHARLLSRQRVEDNLRKEVERNQKEHLSEAGLEPGESALFFNGINLDIDSLDMFQLVDIIKQEERVSRGFFKMGFQREYHSILLAMDFSDDKVKYAVDYRDAFPMFLNNLDTDKRYKHWRNSVKLLLEPYYPGMIRPIARNLFTLIFVVDPAEKESRNLMKIAYSFYKHEIPLRLVRIGLIFAVNENENVTGKDDAGVAILNLFNFLAVDTSNHEALRIVNEMLEPHRSLDQLTPELIRTWFESEHKDADYDDVFGSKTDYDNGRKVGIQFLKRSGIGRAPKVLLNGYVLDDNGITGDKFEETVMMEVMRITPKLQRAVVAGELQDQANVANWIMEQKQVVPRHNKHIFDATAKKQLIDLSETAACKAQKVSDFKKLKEPEKTQCIVSSMKYLKKSDEDQTTPLTMWVVADLDSENGRLFAYDAMKHIRHSKKTRIGIISNPSKQSGACEKGISFLVHAATTILPHHQAKQLITKLVKEEFARALMSGEKRWEDLAVGGMDVDSFNKEMRLLSCDQLTKHSLFANDVLGLTPGARAFIANGVIIGPFDEQESIVQADFELIERIVESQGASVIASTFDKWEFDRSNGFSSDLVMRSFALVSKYASPRKRTWVEVGDDKHSVVTLVAEDTNRASVDIVAVVDPLSRSAQKLSSILQLLRKTINCDMKIIMNPKPKLSELPLKRFYRYVASSELQFSKDGKVVTNQASNFLFLDAYVNLLLNRANPHRFTDLPSKQLLTLSVHSPDAWMVENVFADYDLDNIKMEQASSDVVALFSLEHILLEGHCFDEISGSPPRGLQFVLGTHRKPTQFDTIVMANLGYFQLKANPGAWLLQLREGKSSEIYEVSGHSNTEGNEHEAVRVLIGMLCCLNVEKYDVINIFSLASGHLYERFLNIMMLSVMKNTKKPVKFWLLKNYLSPQFKKTLPLLSAEYGFDYELVEYKWPRWLHQQKEKHRIMWGYKILFLDVLFPLDVQKIIFVDADQVVRADLMELMEYDLGGAPYGYVPFCDSRKEMDGFRFWKQGYWSNHLAGRRYHISALYVIDLQKFRQIAAGDRLRGQYQGLSSDPNSLSNLDQDLPNNMIHQVKIKSLPQEWLWCETWCDDSSKVNAKTIDLCNNPLTKEPKLESAIRIIPEWKDYDAEVKNVLKKGHKDGSSSAFEHSEL